MAVLKGARNAMAAAARGVARFVEAAEPLPDDGAPGAAGTTRDNDAGWKRISGRIGQRDLQPMDQTRMQELAAYVWEANPLANRLIELPAAFLLGEGVRLEVPDAEAQEWLKQFWDHPLNRLDLKMLEHVREGGLFGELLLPVIRNEVNGSVVLAKIDPSHITAVITDPDNAGVVIGVESRDLNGSGELRRWRVIYSLPDVELFSEATCKKREEMKAGECFFLRINTLSSGVRGRSDMLPALDHIDAHEQLLFGEVERAVVLRSIMWDVKMTGATQEQIDARARTTPPPEPLSTRFHNENEEWNLLTPTLNSADAGEAARLVRNHVLGGATIPEFWMADGGNVNLATASSMGEPTYKVFTQRQRLWRFFLEDIARYVIRSRLVALGVGDLANEREYRPKAVFPELTAKDIAKYSTVFAQIVTGAAQAVQAGLMSEESAVRLVVIAAAALGLEVDAKEELARARADAAKRAEADSFTMPPLPPELAPGSPQALPGAVLGDPRVPGAS